MQCYKNNDKNVSSCKNCPVKISCPHESIFIDSSIFLRIILGESEDAPSTENSFNQLKRTCVLFTSHTNIGEVFNRICNEYKSELLRTHKSNAFQIFNQLCLKAHELLDGICLLEINKETAINLNEIIREEDHQSRDRLILSVAIAHQLNSFYTCDKSFVETIKPKIDNSKIKLVYWGN